MIFLSCVFFICIYLILEKKRLARQLAAIPLRLHVYGTRGKTTVTRALFAALRASGLTVLGKTTGDAPFILHADGSEKTLHRMGPARIFEYFECLKLAEQQKCNAVVFECMAISPESIVSATQILDPTHLIITNTRPDHYETMGKTPEAIAQTLSLSVGKSSTVFAGDDAGAIFIEEKTRAFGNAFFKSAEEDFSPKEQAFNMVQKVQQQLNLNLDLKAAPKMPEEDKNLDWQAFQPVFIKTNDKEKSFHFLDLFSANEVYSSQLLLQKALQQFENKAIKNAPLIALLATRADRPLRTKAFLEWFGAEQNVSLFTAIIVQGSHAPYAHWFLHRQNKMALMRANNTNKIRVLPIFNPMLNPQTLLCRIEQQIGAPFCLVGLGNTHGYGEKFRLFVESHA